MASYRGQPSGIEGVRQAWLPDRNRFVFASVPLCCWRVAAETVPDSVEAIFHTDPTTGATDGPFDPTTGLRLMTHTDAAGVMHVLLDPVSKRPVLLTGPDRS
jgi:hypothetical protein